MTFACQRLIRSFFSAFHFNETRNAILILNKEIINFVIGKKSLLNLELNPIKIATTKNIDNRLWMNNK